MLILYLEVAGVPGAAPGVGMGESVSGARGFIS